MSLLSAAAAAAVSVSRSVRPNKILSNLLGQNFKTHTKNCLSKSALKICSVILSTCQIYDMKAKFG
jgi:hypothetical protein